MKSYKNISDTIKQVTKALDELIKCQTVANYKMDVQKEKNKILDVLFSLFMSEQFVTDITKANKLSSLMISYDDDSDEYDASLDTVDFEDLREEMKKDIFKLPGIYINRVVAKVESREIADNLLLSLCAAEDYIKITPSCIPTAITKSAIRDGWTPKRKKVNQIEEFVKKLPEEIEQDRLQKEKATERKKVLRQDPNWLKIRQNIKKTFGEDEWEKWFSELVLLDLKEEEMIIESPSKFQRDWITREFIEKKVGQKNLKDLIQEILPTIRKVVVISNA